MLQRLLKRVRAWTLALRSLLWLVPALMTAGAILLALGSIWLDQRLYAQHLSPRIWFVFDVGAAGVRGVLSSIASSIITVTGVVFSITVVALQLASTQYSPSVLRSFLEDRKVHVVLGVFLATFTYSLLILRSVRAELEDLSAFVPSISATIAVLLALVSIAFLIFFVNHIAHSIRASTIVDRLTREAVDVAASHARSSRAAAAARDDDVPDADAATAWVVAAPRWGYVQSIDESSVPRAPKEHRVTVHVLVQVGDFVREGEPVARVHGDAGDAGGRDALAEAIRRAFTFGSEPTGREDVRYAIGRLVDVAVRSLSPGINDPWTATMCVDGISQVLAVLGRAADPADPAAAAVPAGDRGTQLRAGLTIRTPTFATAAGAAYGRIRLYGARDWLFVTHVLSSLASVGTCVHPRHHAVLAQEARLVARAAMEEIHNADDLARVREAADHALRRLGAGALTAATARSA